MKRILTICLLVLVARVTWAYDFEYKDAASGVTFYYNILSQEDLTCEVTYGDALYTGSITTPTVGVYEETEYKVVRVGASAFQNCTAVTDVTIRSQVTAIGDYAFAGCIGISKVTVLNPEPPVCGEGVFDDVRTRYCYLWVPIGTSEVYSTTEPWSNFSFIEELDGDAFTIDGIYYNVLSASDKTVEVTYSEGKYKGTATYTGHVVIPATVEYAGIEYTVTQIGPWAFDECELTGVTIPETVTNIDTNAFAKCWYLKEIDIPNSVTHIGYMAFGHCTALEKVTIGSGLAELGTEGVVAASGDAVFYANYVLTEFTVADDNEHFCAIDNVFYTKDMTQLLFYPAGLTATSYTIPETVTTLGESAFAENYYIEKVVVPEGVTDMGLATFSSCTSLKEINIPKGVTIIENSLFKTCEALPAVIIPDYVTFIDVQAFTWCKSLKDIVIPNLVTRIDGVGFTFSGCFDLARAVIGQKVEYIAAYGFSYCYALKEIYSLNPEPPETGGAAFEGTDTDNCILYVPAGAKEAYASISVDDTSNPCLWWGLFPEENIREIALTEVETGLAYLESETSMTLTGSVTAGEFDISERGFEYWGEDGAIHQVATTEDMTLTLTDLTEGEVYTYRAYAIDSLSKFYGEERTFTAGVDGIDRVTTSDTTTKTPTGTYNLAGQRVSDSFKGVVIKDGRKVLVK